MPRTQRPFMTTTTDFSVDLTASPGDVILDMVVPGDDARLVDVSFSIEVAGVGAAANHELILEAGTAGAGVAISTQADLDADGAVGLTVFGQPTLTGLTGLTRGTSLQILNAESAAISTGAIVNVVCIWGM